jgi:hypothetical protein
MLNNTGVATLNIGSFPTTCGVSGLGDPSPGIPDRGRGDVVATAPLPLHSSKLQLILTTASQLAMSVK